MRPRLDAHGAHGCNAATWRHTNASFVSSVSEAPSGSPLASAVALIRSHVATICAAMRR